MRFSLIIATGFGSGYAPVAPGTFGSLVGLALFWLLSRFVGPLGPLVGLAFVTPLGVWAAGRAEAYFGTTDPGAVVIDEIAGQMLTLLFLPHDARWLIVGFVLFRALDVIKPFPASRLERLPGGSGIMADDLMVAIYGNLALHLVQRFLPGLLGA